MPILHDLQIQGFRGLNELHVTGFADVNLIVGANNAGKTTFLEAIAAYVGDGDAAPILASCYRRGEIIANDTNERTSVDVRHLFHGHPECSAEFVISSGNSQVTAKLEPRRHQPTLFEDYDEELTNWQLSTHGKNNSSELPLARLGGGSVRRRILETAGSYAQFISTTDEHYQDLGLLWDEVLLTPKEEHVIAALRLIDPKVNRLAYVGRSRDPFGPFGNFFVKLNDNHQERMPIGSMGDGMKRILALSLHLAKAAGGVLLIDEVDTGLHHSVLTKTWKMLVKTAVESKTQVFATTHSLDCLRSLAALCESEPDLSQRVAVFRLESQRKDAIRFDGHELMTAVQHELEIR